MTVFNAVSDLRLGDTPIRAAYLGDIKVWPTSVPVSAELTGTGVLSATAYQSAAVSPQLSGHGQLLATARPLAFVSAQLSGHGQLSGSAQRLVFAPLSGHGLLSGAALARAARAVPLTGTGKLSATTLARATSTPKPTGTGRLSATAIRRLFVSAALAAKGQLHALAKEYQGAPPVFDGAGGNAVSGSTISWTHQVTAGAYVEAYVNVGGNTNCNSVTFGAGVNMTQVTMVGLNNQTNQGRLYKFKLDSAPVTGLITVTATMQGGNNALAGSSVSYLGVTEVKAPTTVFGSSANPSTVLTPPEFGIALRVLGSRSTITASSGGTQRYRSSTAAGLLIQDDDTPGATTFGSTMSSSTWATIGTLIVGFTGPPPVENIGTVNLAGKGQLSATAHEKLPVPTEYRAAALGASGRLAATASGQVTPSGFSDTFARANAANLGSAWTNVSGTMAIDTNRAIGGTTSTANWNLARYNTLAPADNVFAEADWGSTDIANNSPYLMIACNTTGADAVFLYNWNNQYLFLNTQVNWVQTQRPQWAGNPSGRVRLQRVGNVYTVAVNGTTRITWTDSGNAYPRDASHRVLIIGADRKSSTGYGWFQNWQAGSP